MVKRAAVQELPYLGFSEAEFHVPKLPIEEFVFLLAVPHASYHVPFPVGTNIFRECVNGSHGKVFSGAWQLVNHLKEVHVHNL